MRVDVDELPALMRAVRQACAEGVTVAEIPPLDIECRCGNQIHIPVTITRHDDGRVIIGVDHEWLTEHFAGHVD
jgi:hypothetical protein